jgi:Conjugative transposon protein TcpC
MVRGSGVDDPARSAAYADAPETGSGPPGKRPRRSWNGGGGRWFVWTVRAVLWAVLLIIGYRGIMAIVLNETPASRSSTPAGTSTGGATSSFPVTLADAYALQFSSVFLNFSPATADQRARQLAAFVPSSISGADPQLGWNGSGTLKLDSEQVASTAVHDNNRAVVTVLASVNGELMELGVPIYTANGALAVSGDPAWLPAPAQATPPSTAPTTADPTAQAALNAQLPAFFQAYASGDTATLNRFLAPGASVTGLGGSLSYAGISSLSVPTGGDTRTIAVTVTWQLVGQTATPAKFNSSYEMTVVNQGGKWFVRTIQASTQTGQAGSS